MNFTISRSAVVTAAAAFAAGAILRPDRSCAQTSILRIGNSGVEDQAQAVYAEELGLFKQAGLTVEVLIQRGGAATVTAVAGGALEIGCANTISLGQALQRKLPFTMLVPASIWDSKHPRAYAVVAPDSPLKSGKDLNGKTVGVGSLNGSAQLFIQAFVQRDGGDASTIKFIEIPDALVPEALAQGRIDASLLSEPVFSGAASRVRSIGAAPDAIGSYFADTVWFTRNNWLAKNKDVARLVISALIAAGKWAVANRVAAAAILDKRLGFKEAQAQDYYATNTDANLVQLFYDRAAEYKILPAMRAAEFTWNGK